MRINLQLIWGHIRSSLTSGQGSASTAAGRLATALARRPGQVLELFVFRGSELVESHLYDASARQLCRADPQQLLRSVAALKDFMQDSFGATGNSVSFSMSSGLHVTASMQAGCTVVALAHGASGARTVEKWLTDLASKAGAA